MKVPNAVIKDFLEVSVTVLRKIESLALNSKTIVIKSGLFETLVYREK